MKLTKEQKLTQIIIKEALKNESFKKELVENPIQSIERFTNEQVTLPKGKHLVVSDQTDQNSIYINIPAEMNMDDAELNEEQLEAVAGGLAADPVQIPGITTKGNSTK